MPPHFQTYPPNNAPIPTGNNGIENHPQEQHEDPHKQSRGRPRPHPQSQMQQQQQQQQQGPPLYPPSNNGYNRPRQNRNLGRPNNRQHQ